MPPETARFFLGGAVVRKMAIENWGLHKVVGVKIISVYIIMCF